MSRPRHRFFEAPSSGRRTKFSHVVWASENSDPRASGGCRARGQGQCAGHQASLSPALLPQWKVGNLRPRPPWAGLRAHTRNMAMGHRRPPLGIQTRTHRARAWGLCGSQDLMSRHLILVLCWSDRVPSRCTGSPSRQAHPHTHGASPTRPNRGLALAEVGSKEQEQVLGGGGGSKSFRATQSWGEDGHRPCFVLGIRCVRRQPWRSCGPAPQARTQATAGQPTLLFEQGLGAAEQSCPRPCPPPPSSHPLLSPVSAPGQAGEAGAPQAAESRKERITLGRGAWAAESVCPSLRKSACQAPTGSS